MLKPLEPGNDGGAIILLMPPHTGQNRKLTLMIGKATQEDLLEIHQEHGWTISDCVRRAIRVYKVLLDTIKDGSRIIIVGPSDATQRELVLK